MLGQQFMHTVDRMVADAGDDIPKPFLWIDPVEFACSQQGVEDGGPLSAFMASGKQIVLAAQGDGANGVFYEVIVDFQSSVEDINPKFFPSGKGVAEGFA